MRFETKVLERLDRLLEMGEAILENQHRVEGAAGRSVYGEQAVQWRTSCLNFLSRVLGEDSQHYRYFPPEGYRVEDAQNILGVLRAAKDDIESGFLFERDLLVAADVFDDILEQAEHLLQNKYKDAAAVLIGAALESTLRKICTRHSIAIAGYETIDPLNAKLAKQELYTKLVQKQITTWADIRNNAAHGHFDKYTQADVEAMDKWVRSFIEQQLT